MAVHLAVGQCGNQVAAQFWEQAQAEFSLTPGATASSLDRATIAAPNHANPLTDDMGWATAVMVDSEPKVIQSVLKRRGCGVLRSGDAVYDQSGRGNLWAWGYNETSSRLTERAVEALRRKVEMTDRFSTVVMFHSLGGGSGSGLGSRMMECVRDSYPGCFVVTGSVLPFAKGDTPLQNYNAVLTLWKLQEYADAVMLFNNDDLMARVATSKAGSKRASIADLNVVCGHALSHVLFPYRDANHASTVSAWKGRRRSALRGFDGGTFSRRLCPGGRYKFVDVRSVPHGTRKERKRLGQVPQWSQLGSSLSRALPRYDKYGRRVEVVACRVIARGVEQPDLASAAAVTSRAAKADDVGATPPDPDGVGSRAGAGRGAGAGARAGSRGRPGGHNARGRGEARHKGAGRGEARKRRQHGTQWECPETEEWKQVARSVAQVGLPPPWADPLAFQLCPGKVRSLCTVRNSTATSGMLGDIVYRARLKYDAGAYVHWYERHGCESYTIAEALDAVEDVVTTYDELIPYEEDVREGPGRAASAASAGLHVAASPRHDK